MKVDRQKEFKQFGMQVMYKLSAIAEIQPIKKLIVLLLSMFSASNAQSQDSVTIKTVLQPNQKYLNTTHINMTSIIDIEKNNQLIAKFLAQGAHMPIMINGSGQMKSLMRTQAENKGRIPFITEITMASTDQEFNNEKTQLKNALEGTKIYGYSTNDDHFIIDSIINDQLNEQSKGLLKSSYEQTGQRYNSMVSLKIGDTFQKSKPTSIQIIGYGELKFNVVTTFKLQSIENNMAYFITEMIFTLTTEDPSTEITTKCNGNGKAQFDLQHTFMKVIDAQYNIFAKIKNKNIIISGNYSFDTSDRMEMQDH